MSLSLKKKGNQSCLPEQTNASSSAMTTYQTFQCYKPKTRKVIISRNVVFDDQHFEGINKDNNEEPLTSQDIDFFPKEFNNITTPETRITTQGEQFVNSIATELVDLLDNSELNEDALNQTTPPMLGRSTKQRHSPHFSNLSTSLKPLNLPHAMKP